MNQSYSLGACEKWGNCPLSNYRKYLLEYSPFCDCQQLTELDHENHSPTAGFLFFVVGTVAKILD